MTRELERDGARGDDGGGVDRPVTLPSSSSSTARLDILALVLRFFSARLLVAGGLRGDTSDAVEAVRLRDFATRGGAWWEGRVGDDENMSASFDLVAGILKWAGRSGIGERD